MNYKNMPRYNSSKNVDYKRELLKYRKAIVSFNSDVKWLRKYQERQNAMLQDKFSYPSVSLVEEEVFQLPAYRYLIDDEFIQTSTCKGSVLNENKDQNIIDKIMQLEQEPMITFQEEFGIEEEMDLIAQDNFLYHGIRLGNPLEVLEKILKSKKILAKKYIDNYGYDDENCNEGEYVSVMNYCDSYEFEVFVRENICFVISPFIEAYKTKYLSWDEWSYMKKHSIPVHNRYSYARYEYQVKDEIPLEKVRAIGIANISLLRIKLTQGVDEANRYVQQIKDLLEKYSVDLPIVDIDFYNSELHLPNKEKVKK